ncbi:Uncharacterised protein [Legionella sainthelensi]|nr:Uncharacterised protein [Legionella sainthelensi]
MLLDPASIWLYTDQEDTRASSQTSGQHNRRFSLTVM